MFQFPSNGKAYPKLDCPHDSSTTLVMVSIPFKREKPIQRVCFISFSNRSVSCFNSLQTGKPIQRQTPKQRKKQALKHSFNSLQTGKPIQSYPNSSYAAYAILMVSIPFKRESLSKDTLSKHSMERPSRQFQFPSNGKAYPKADSLTWLQSESLQVSIPFKRESLSKAPDRIQARHGYTDLVSIPFKRESLSKVKKPAGQARQQAVSIPFKRESLSKETPF